MKKLMGLIAIAVFMVTSAGSVHASTATRDFNLSANLTALVTSASLVLSSIDSKGTEAPGDDAWTQVGTGGSGATMSFGNLAQVDGVNPVTHVPFSFFGSNTYFAIDLSTVGYVSTTGLTVSYTEGTNQNTGNVASPNGLGYKTVAKFVKATVAGTETQYAASKKLADLTGAGLTIAPNTLAQGGWLRMYVGIVSDPSAVAGSEVFSAADKAGSYTGVLHVSMTAV